MNNLQDTNVTQGFQIQDQLLTVNEPYAQQQQQLNTTGQTQYMSQQKEDMRIVGQIISVRQCLSIGLGILVSLDILVFIGQMVVGTTIFQMVIDAVGISLVFFELYGVRVINGCIILFGFIWCIIGIVIITVVALMVIAAGFDLDESAGQKAFVILIVLIPLIIEAIIEIVLIINFGKLRAALNQWRESHGGAEFKLQ